MAAKYYIYRNLHTGGFSIKYRGRVISRPMQFIATNVTFKVNESGRQRVIKEKQKNVHAYATTLSEPVILKYDIRVNSNNEVSYNPYKTNYFFNKINNQPITKVDILVGIDGKIFKTEEMV